TVLLPPPAPPASPTLPLHDALPISFPRARACRPRCPWRGSGSSGTDARRATRHQRSRRGSGVAALPRRFRAPEAPFDRSASVEVHLVLLDVGRPLRRHVRIREDGLDR